MRNRIGYAAQIRPRMLMARVTVPTLPGGRAASSKATFLVRVSIATVDPQL